MWTGSEMIVWGGNNDSGFLNTGGRYNPSSDSWTTTSTNNAPDARDGHTAVWTGSEMIVWGGLARVFERRGEIQSASTDTWTPTNVPTPRAGHTAMWTGSEMIFWGGNGIG